MNKTKEIINIFIYYLIHDDYVLDNSIYYPLTNTDLDGINNIYFDCLNTYKGLPVLATFFLYLDRIREINKQLNNPFIIISLQPERTTPGRISLQIEDGIDLNILKNLVNILFSKKQKES